MITSFGEDITREGAMWRDAARRLGVQQSDLIGQRYQWGVGGRLDVTNSGWQVTGGSPLMSLVVPGALRLATGQSVQNTNNAFFPRVDNGQCFFRTRAHFDGMAASAATAIVIIRNTGTRSMSIGAYGATSETHIQLQYDGVLAGTFANLHEYDDAEHDYDVWWLGDTKVHFGVDGVEVAEITPTSPPDAMSYLYQQASNSELLQHDFFWATPRG